MSSVESVCRIMSSVESACVFSAYAPPPPLLSVRHLSRFVAKNVSHSIAAADDSGEPRRNQCMFSLAVGAAQILKVFNAILL